MKGKYTQRKIITGDMLKEIKYFLGRDYLDHTYLCISEYKFNKDGMCSVFHNGDCHVVCKDEALHSLEQKGRQLPSGKWMNPHRVYYYKVEKVQKELFPWR